METLTTDIPMTRSKTSYVPREIEIVGMEEVNPLLDRNAINFFREVVASAKERANVYSFKLSVFHDPEGLIEPSLHLVVKSDRGYALASELLKFVTRHNADVIVTG